jgi:hypothetical protein
MFVRWKRQRRGRSTLLCAYLVESYRRSGKTRHRVLSYLAGITEETVRQFGTSRSRSRRILAADRIADFWERVDRAIEEFPDERQTIFELLLRRIPVPDPRTPRKGSDQFNDLVAVRSQPDTQSTATPRTTVVRVELYSGNILAGEVTFDLHSPWGISMTPRHVLNYAETELLRMKLVRVPRQTSGTVGRYAWRDVTLRAR